LIVLGGVIHADRGGLDRDAFLAFQVHGVEHLVVMSRSEIVPVSWSRRSASVDLP
jgi:hypothetical protein